MKVNISFTYSLDKNKDYGKNVVTTIVQMLTKISSSNFYSIYVITDDQENDLTFGVKKYINTTNGEIRVVFPNFDIIKNVEKNVPVTDPKGTYACYYRLFLSEILKDVEKIAYFDSDVYFNCDVAEFYNFDLSQNYIAGSRDLWCAKGRDINKNNNDELGDNCLDVKKTEKFICAGVILLNLDLIRKDKIFDLFVAEIYKKHKTQDQDIFNIVCNRKILNLPLRYGMINRTEYIKSAHIYNMTKKEMKNEIKNIKIVHGTYPKFWDNYKTDKNFKPIIGRLGTRVFRSDFIGKGKKIFKNIFA